MFDFNEREKARVAERIAAMTIRINNQIRTRDAFAARSKDPQALYFCGYEMAPDFLKTGDVVFTKYGVEGVVAAIDRENEQFVLREENGNTVREGTDRISGLSYGDVQYEKEPLSHDDYGWE